MNGFVSPYELLASYRDRTYVALLENPGAPSRFGRYAFICTDPFWVFRSKRDRCWSGPPDAQVEVAAPPLVELSRLLARHRSERSHWQPDQPPFTGGAIGYLGYELLYQLEDIPDTGRDDVVMPDTYLLFCGLVFATDLVERTSWVLATGFGDSPREAEAEAEARLQSGHRQLAALQTARPIAGQVEQYRSMMQRERQARPRLYEEHLDARRITPCIDRPGYIAAIENAKENIFRGNIFEVCLTQRFDLTLGVEGQALYDVLRAVNPAPMGAYLRFPEGEVLSSSPERFLSMDRAGLVETRPIKGTRPRGETREEDIAHRDDLAAAEKDRAENIMIVDLARNDLGRVCTFGTVRVSELCAIEPYEYTWQMVSTVQGRLRDGCDAVDLLRATFPGGSMTGAPKVEAMKHIDRLEPTKRGVFSGTIGYIDFDGAMDWNIVIRTLIKQKDFLTFHVGGAIVADSDAAEEYQETLDKANGLVMAMDIASAAGLCHSSSGD